MVLPLVLLLVPLLSTWSDLRVKMDYCLKLIGWVANIHSKKEANSTQTRANFNQP